MQRTQTEIAAAGFGRSFLPGLVLGVIVGGFAGAILPEFLPRTAGGQTVVNATAVPASRAGFDPAARHAAGAPSNPVPLEPSPEPSPSHPN